MDGFIESIPKRRMTASALFFNEAGELLIVKPTYRDDDDWLVVGGAVDQNESPYDGCKREICEELGNDFSAQQLLCIEYQSSSGVNRDSLHFVFYGGVLNQKQIRQIKLPMEELAEYRFCSLDEGMRLLSSRLGERLVFALEALEQRRVIYIENKVEVGRWI
jgi:8-oxo-dGTP pyrophosphatase MutT (NUDIX family)